MTEEGRTGAAAPALEGMDPAVDRVPTAPVTRDELMMWGERIGRRLARPSVVAISGELGAGKTTLIQAICRGHGVEQDVTSPTFALVHEYASKRGPVFHLDLYRLRGPEDLTNLAWDDITGSDALVLIEWPERAGERLPPGALRIALSEDAEDENRRLIRMSG